MHLRMYVPCINVCVFYRLGPVFTYLVMVVMLFVCSVQGKYLLVMMSSGVLYSQPIVPECSANDGPVYLVNEIEVSHEQVDVRVSIVCSYII